MGTPENRPASGFYADSNNPEFPKGYFDKYFPLVALSVHEYAVDASQGFVGAEHLDPYIEETLADSAFDWDTPPEDRYDLIVQMPGEQGSTFIIKDQGKGTLQALQQSGLQDPQHPHKFRDRGIITEKDVADFHTANEDTHFLVNSDSIILADPSNPIGEDGEDLTFLGIGDPAQQLLEAGVSMIFVTQLIFDADGQPAEAVVDTIEHQQFGVYTHLGFVPFFTRLATAHPAVTRYNQQLDPELIRRAGQQLEAQKQELRKSNGYTDEP